MWVDRPESPLTYNQMFRRRMEPAVLTTKLVNSADPGTQYQSLSCKLSGSHLGFGSSLRTHRQQLDNTDCILQPCSRESALLRALFFVSVTPHSTWPQQSRMVLRTGIQTEGKFHGTLRFHNFDNKLSRCIFVHTKITDEFSALLVLTKLKSLTEYYLFPLLIYFVSLRWKHRLANSRAWKELHNNIASREVIIGGLHFEQRVLGLVCKLVLFSLFHRQSSLRQTVR